MFRRRSNVFVALPVALLAAAAFGVQLGQSAISQINPIHFQGAEPRPRGIDPIVGPPAPDGFAQAYGWEDGYAARAADCGADCDARRARDAMVFALDAEVRPRPAAGPYWRDATPAAEPKSWPPGATGEGALSVERYMHYPVEEQAVEDADLAPPPDEDEFGADE